MSQTNGSTRRVAVVTGASAGIGAATAHLLVHEGFTVVAGARRVERLEDFAHGHDVDAHQLDVTDPASIAAFTKAVGEKHGKVDVLINNAGLALGTTYLPETKDEDWITMFETNVLGIVRMTRALLPLIKKAPHGHIVNVGSVAGFDVYPGGSGYLASKHAVRAITNGLRLELNGQPIRVTEVAPGMTRTEFADVRTGGDQAKVEKMYEGVETLQADDIAECIAFAITRPPHVNIDYLVVRPRDQAASYMLHRTKAQESAR